jgi:hypothetical protein
MTTQRPGRVTETPDDLVTAAVITTAPLIVTAALRRLVATAEHGPPGGHGGHLWLAQGELQPCANQLDPRGGGDRR